jgi:phosphohistidine phosphatase
MILYVMRHGPAEDRAPNGNDADRRLTAAGREIVTRAAKELLRLRGSSLPRIVSSRRTRARETASLLADIAGGRVPPEMSTDLSSEGAMPLGLLDDLVAAESDVALVGHHPTVEHLVHHLAPQATAIPTGFRTAMIVALEVSRAPNGRATGEVCWVVDPHSMS